tara:strand:- start:45 stop:617 length:573 start_codon:yes stop_codon:yes gene_type:complete
MAVTQSAAFSSSLSFNETTTLGDQTQVEKYFLSDSTSIPTGTGGTPTNYFNSYAKSTGTLASGDTLTLDFTAIPHQAITGGDVTRTFQHINAFYFEPTSSTGVDDTFIIRATGTAAFTNLFYGGSGGPAGHPVRAYAPFNYVDYYGTNVGEPYPGAPGASSQDYITIYNAGFSGGPSGLDYKYMAVGFTG